MPIPDVYKPVLTALSTKTDQGVLQWKEDAYDISVQIDSSLFSLWAGTDEHTDEPFVAFALKDNTGKPLDSWYLDQSDTDYYAVFEFYKLAKRHASGVPALLKTLAERIAAMNVDSRK